MENINELNIYEAIKTYNKKDIFNQLIGYNNVENSNLYYPLMLQMILENNLQVSYEDIENLRNYMDIKKEKNNFHKEKHENLIKEESKSN